uniref:Uncharacterized protein n=1 Tax=Mandrillus leucophaeus TaxID=9568 RepID=A0A2K5YB02_MANLE
VITLKPGARSYARWCPHSWNFPPGLVTYYLRLYPGDVTLLTRPSLQMRLYCTTGSAPRPRPQMK